MVRRKGYYFAAAAVFVVIAGQAQANSSRLAQFRGISASHQKWAVDNGWTSGDAAVFPYTVRAACAACHTNADPNANSTRNAYGNAFATNNGETPATRFGGFSAPGVDITAVQAFIAASAAPSSQTAVATLAPSGGNWAPTDAKFFVTAGGADFEISGTTLYLKSGRTLSPGTLSATVAVNAYPTENSAGPATNAFLLTITAGAPPPPSPTNNPPTAVLLQNVVSSVSDGTLSNRLRVADITVTDDNTPTYAITPVGPDAALFEVIGGQLFLKANTTLDAASKASLSVGVAVDDPLVGSNPDAESALTTIAVSQTNGPPTISLENVVSTLNQGANAAGPVRVANIRVTDDLRGGSVNNLSLAGADAATFELVGLQLFVRQGAVLDAKERPELRVLVQVDDPALGAGVDASVEHKVAVTLPLGAGLIEQATDNPLLKSAAAALDDVCVSLAALSTGARTADQSSLFNACSQLSLSAQAKANIDQALAAVRNEESFVASDAAFSMARMVNDGIFGRMGNAPGGRGRVDVSGLRFNTADPGLATLASAAPLLLAAGLNGLFGESPNAKWGAFVSGYVQDGSRSAGGAAGAVSFDGVGFTAGLDYLFADKFLAGVAVSYANAKADFDLSASEMEADGFTLSLYGSVEGGALLADGQVSVGKRNYAAVREIAFSSGPLVVSERALSDYDGLEVVLGGRLRLPIALNIVDLELIAGGTAILSQVDAYEERGATGFNLFVEEQNNHVVFGDIGASVSRTLDFGESALRAGFDVMYTRQAGQGSREITAGFVADPMRRANILLTSELENDPDFFTVGASLGLRLGGGVGIVAGYRTILGWDDADLQQVTLTLTGRF